jgi:hypothetical protein
MYGDGQTELFCLDCKCWAGPLPDDSPRHSRNASTPSPHLSIYQSPPLAPAVALAVPRHTQQMPLHVCSWADRHPPSRLCFPSLREWVVGGDPESPAICPPDLGAKHIQRAEQAREVLRLDIAQICDQQAGTDGCVVQRKEDDGVLLDTGLGRGWGFGFEAQTNVEDPRRRFQGGIDISEWHEGEDSR